MTEVHHLIPYRAARHMFRQIKVAKGHVQVEEGAMVLEDRTHVKDVPRTTTASRRQRKSRYDRQILDNRAHRIHTRIRPSKPPRLRT